MENFKQEMANKIFGKKVTVRSLARVNPTAPKTVVEKVVSAVKKIVKGKAKK